MTAIQKGACNVSVDACVYMLIDPIKQEPFYIGVGGNSRPFAHFKGPCGNTFKWRKIQKLRRFGIADADMVAYVALGVSPEVARCTEEWLVMEWGRRTIKTGPLTNMTPGGERSPMLDPVVKQKVATSNKEAWATTEVRDSQRNARSKPEAKARHIAGVRAAWEAAGAKEKHSVRMKIAANTLTAKINRAAVWERPGAKEKRAAVSKAIHLRPGIKTKHSTAIKVALARPEVKAKMIAAARMAHNAPEIKKRHSDGMVKKWQDAEYRKRVTDALKAAMAKPGALEKRNAAIKAAHSTPEARKKNSERQRWAKATPEARANLSEIARATWARPGEKERRSEIARKASLLAWARRKGTQE